MSIQYQQFPELSVLERNQLFSIYAKDAGSFLLDSSNSEHPNGRYDIIAVQPLQIISCPAKYNTDPLDQLKQLHNKISQQIIPEEIHHLPCLGGILFAISYDLGRCYEQIDNHAINDLQLADLYAGIFGCVFIIDHQDKCSYLVCIDDNSTALYNKLANEISHISKQTENAHSEQFTLISDWHANFTEDEYADAFNQVQEYIKAGDCYQINLAQRFTAKCTGSSWLAYCQLSEANSAPFSAFINTGEAEILSLSPERFIELKDNQAETRPIKGTRPRGQTSEDDQLLRDELIASKKDQAENLMIVDLMRNDLGKSCKPGTINVSELFKLESFHSVHHLVSTIKGELETGENAFTLLAKCFPGGSITGAPKIRAMNIIEQLEPHRRSFYCGSIGYIDVRGNMDCSISIRTLVRKDDHIYCWAGGGLVSESNQEAEYQETFDKVSRILPVLQKNTNLMKINN